MMDSRYDPYWTQLKQSGTIVLDADPRMHKRLKKAITKRKSIDNFYRLAVAERNKSSKLEFSIARDINGNPIPSQLVIKLIEYVGMNNL